MKTIRNRRCIRQEWIRGLTIVLATSILSAGSPARPAWESLAQEARKLAEEAHDLKAIPPYRTALEEAEGLPAPPAEVVALLRDLALAYHRHALLAALLGTTLGFEIRLARAESQVRRGNKGDAYEQNENYRGACAGELLQSSLGGALSSGRSN
jgi:hypothetical protein